MNEFEKILQECLLTLDTGESTMDECLIRHPQYASQLEPILLTTFDLERGREARPSSEFKSRVRARLRQEMRAYPRRSIRINFMFMRVAVGFAALMLAFLVTGTVYAQKALPGETFYAWKRASEEIWRAVSPDPVGTDLLLAQRRAAELIALGNDSEQRAEIMEAYLDVVDRLELELDAENETRIRPTLESQMEELKDLGIILPQPEQTPLPTLNAPTKTPQPTPVIPDVKLTLPAPTILPKIEPTIHIHPPIP